MTDVAREDDLLGLDELDGIDLDDDDLDDDAVDTFAALAATVADLRETWRWRSAAAIDRKLLGLELRITMMAAWSSVFEVKP